MDLNPGAGGDGNSGGISRDTGDEALGWGWGVMEGMANGSAAEEELGRLTECGKPRVPPARAVREPWGPYVRSTWLGSGGRI